MDERELLSLWNTKRTQIITAQFAPSFVLVAVFVTAAFGKFADATDAVRYLTIGVITAVGVLTVINQYAVIREAEALLLDLGKIEKKSELGKKVAESRSYLSLSAIAIVGLSLAVFILVIWAVLA